LIAPGRTRTCGPLLSIQHQDFPDRPSWVCWLDYILDIAVPTRIVSEDPLPKQLERFPADYPIPPDCYFIKSTVGSKGVPAYRIVHLTGSQFHFPIKAPTRQMLYPLSYGGTSVH
jgi:hypothetical protein